jgi:hypothetical protein
VGVTDDRNDPRLTHGVDNEPVEQAEVYLVLSEADRAKGRVRPIRNQYVHRTCNQPTRMGQALAETWAKDPQFYGATLCVHCQMHRPVSEFTWMDDGTVLGS